MPFSTDVNLPKAHKAQFPDICVVCSQPEPNSWVRLRTGAIGWWSWSLWMFGKMFSVTAPACAPCARHLRLKRLSSLLMTIGLILVAATYLWPMLPEDMSRSARRWSMLGLAILCISPYILYQVVFPPSFDITAFKHSVDYEFRDPELAYAFAEENEDAEWVKVE